MPDQPRPPRPGDRDRIVDALDETLFVEAGAGSGKTTALVDPVVALVTSGAVELAAIAAITFTEKAAAELRDRIRRALRSERRRTTTDAVAAVPPRSTSSTGRHRHAPLLRPADPVGAPHRGRPAARVEVLDEVSSGVEYERRWSAFREELLADRRSSAPPAPARQLRWRSRARRPRRARSRTTGTSSRTGPDSAPRATDVPPGAPGADRLDDVCAARRLPRRRRPALGRSTRSPTTPTRLRGIDDEYDLLEALDPDRGGRRASRSATGDRKGNWPDSRSRETGMRRARRGSNVASDRRASPAGIGSARRSAASP